ncbi:MAG: FKBP-type peptidyl-prolyl cis-trans isomerase [Endozoicomonas sp. (ex Botrylloides leachii)]|nr:FKBP-type peptidyl-prolyl cis-trans isomerase [Endozoicomonas sp. (ex Botrylloides leachii)]
MKLRTFIGITLVSCSLQALASTPASTGVDLSTKEGKLSYSLGVVMAEQLKQFDGINADDLTQGIKDILNNKPPQIDRQEMFKLIDEARVAQEKKMQEKFQAEASENLKAGQAFLTENAKKPDIKVLDGGLQYKIIKEGKGIKPTANDEVVVQYEGRLLNGKVFDSSYQRNEPAVFRVNQVIRGWTEALEQMPEGSEWELYIPSDMAYGPNGIPGRIGPNSVLLFKVQLLDVKKEGGKDETTKKLKG